MVSEKVSERVGGRAGGRQLKEENRREGWEGGRGGRGRMCLGVGEWVMVGGCGWVGR
jgi:hypothetical protein